MREQEAINKLIDFIGHPEWNDLHVFAVIVISNCLEDTESVEVSCFLQLRKNTCSDDADADSNAEDNDKIDDDGDNDGHESKFRGRLFFWIVLARNWNFCVKIEQIPWYFLGFHAKHRLSAIFCVISNTFS